MDMIFGDFLLRLTSIGYTMGAEFSDVLKQSEMTYIPTG